VDVDRGWRFVSIGLEGQPADVGGVNPWEVKWTATGGRITVAHPQYRSQRRVMFVYEVTDSVPRIRFAAGEFSNGVWGFFVPAMLDDRLIGYWSDEPLYQGSMEAADIAFRSDGTGWTYWSRAGGTFRVDRFSWYTGDGHVTLDLHENLYGTWHLEDHTTRHRVRTRDADHKHLVLTYQITAGQNALHKPAAVLQLEQPIRLGTIGDRFAFKRTLAENEQDPTTRSP